MSFAIYADAASIKVDPASGEYPRGKANVEVIAVSDTTSTCRLLSESKGNPVAVGDSVANALYDPSKTYSFLIYGNFDVNNDAIATPTEQSDLKALIEGWGGKSVDYLGDVDFLVLGRPPDPPAPPGAPTPPSRSCRSATACCASSSAPHPVQAGDLHRASPSSTRTACTR